MRGPQPTTSAGLAAALLFAAFLTGCAGEVVPPSAAVPELLRSTEPASRPVSAPAPRPTSAEASQHPEQPVGRDMPFPASSAAQPELPSTTTSGGRLPGSATDGPAAGVVLGVVGVSYDDVLNVRALPGAAEVPLTAVQPTGEVVATGRARTVAGAPWYEVRVQDRTGWASGFFLAQAGETVDLTATVLDVLGETPRGGLYEIGDAVATAVVRASDSGAGNARYCMSAAPTVGDLGEVAFDVVHPGRYLNSVVLPVDVTDFGWRLHVFATPVDGGFALTSVEATRYCTGSCP